MGTGQIFPRFCKRIPPSSLLGCSWGKKCRRDLSFFFLFFRSMIFFSFSFSGFNNSFFFSPPPPPPPLAENDVPLFSLSLLLLSPSFRCHQPFFFLFFPRNEESFIGLLFSFLFLSPPHTRFFFFSFVEDYNVRRFSSFSPPLRR